MGRTRFIRGLSFVKRRVFVSCGFYLVGRAAFVDGNAVIPGGVFLYRTDLLMLRRAFASIVMADRCRFGNAHYEGSA